MAVNREIKFRCWDKEENEMIYFQSPVVDKEQALLFVLEGRKESWIDTHLICMDVFGENLILMQFTGLLDKNGVEIYEGDLVTYGEDEARQIVFKDCAFTFDNTEMPLGRFRNNIMEVIGNLYSEEK